MTAPSIAPADAELHRLRTAMNVVAADLTGPGAGPQRLIGDKPVAGQEHRQGLTRHAQDRAGNLGLAKAQDRAGNQGAAKAQDPAGNHGPAKAQNPAGNHGPAKAPHRIGKVRDRCARFALEWAQHGMAQATRASEDPSSGSRKGIPAENPHMRNEAR